MVNIQQIAFKSTTLLKGAEEMTAKDSVIF